MVRTLTDMDTGAQLDVPEYASADLSEEPMTEEDIRADEREKIATALDVEADTTPCSEDAVVVRDCARLIRARFNYEEAERIAETEST